MSQNIISQINIQGVNHFIASSAYGVCNTAANVSNKVVNIQNVNAKFTLNPGTTIHVKFIHHNEAANPTLTVNGISAAPIFLYNNERPGTTIQTSWFDNSIISLTYDGNAFIANDFSLSGSGGGSDIDVPQPGNTASPILANISSSGGNQSTTTYSRSDHTHGINITQGSSNGTINIAGQEVAPKNLKTTAFQDLSTSISSASSNTQVPTAKAVYDYVRSQGGGGSGGGGGTVSDSPAFYQVEVTTNMPDESSTVKTITASANRDSFKIVPGRFGQLNIENNAITVGTNLSRLNPQEDGQDLSLVKTGDIARWDAAAASSGDVVQGGVTISRGNSEFDTHYNKMIIDNHETPQGQPLINKLNMAITYNNGNLNFTAISEGGD